MPAKARIGGGLLWAPINLLQSRVLPFFNPQVARQDLIKSYLSVRCTWTLWFHYSVLVHVPLLWNLWTWVWIWGRVSVRCLDCHPPNSPPSVSYPEKNSRLTVWHGLLHSPVSKCLLNREDRSSPPPSSHTWAGWHEVLNTCTWHLQGIQISCRIVTEYLWASLSKRIMGKLPSLSETCHLESFLPYMTGWSNRNFVSLNTDRGRPLCIRDWWLGSMELLSGSSECPAGILS